MEISNEARKVAENAHNEWAESTLPLDRESFLWEKVRGFCRGTRIDTRALFAQVSEAFSEISEREHKQRNPMLYAVESTERMQPRLRTTPRPLPPVSHQSRKELRKPTGDRRDWYKETEDRHDENVFGD